MVNIHDFSAFRARRASARKAIAVTAIGAAAVVIAGAVSFASLSEFSTVALVHANANARASTPVGTTPANVSDTAARVGTRDFDYFPDHYRNQAHEPAEPIATF